jgi:hypothetical protein
MEPSENEIRFAMHRHRIWGTILEIAHTAEYILDIHPSSLSANLDNRIASLTVQKVGDEEMALSMTYRNIWGHATSCLIHLCATGEDMHPILTCVFADAPPISIEFPYKDVEGRHPYAEFRNSFVAFLKSIKNSEPGG